MNETNKKLQRLYNVPKEASQQEVIRALAEGVAPALAELSQSVSEMVKKNRQDEEVMNRLISGVEKSVKLLQKLEKIDERLSLLEEVLYTNIKAK